MNEIILGLITVIGQGVFAGSETAFAKANWIRLMTWAKRSNLASVFKVRVNTAIGVLEKKEQVLIITLILTNLFVVMTSVIFSRFFIIYFGPAYTIVSVILVVILSLVFGDFLPKVIAQAFAEYWVIIISPLIRLLLIVFSPILPKVRNNSYYKLSRQDFLSLLKEKKTKDSPTLNQMAKALFEFSQMTVGEIMIPKERIVGLPEDVTYRQAKKIIEKYRFSRYPIYQKNLNKIIAIIHIKDIIWAIKSKTWKLKEFYRKPYLVSAKDKAIMVLKTMSRQGEHLAIVQNEQAETVGIITLEDLLEEVVGEIRSET
ncbi:MAG: CNNM domain-containing protein [candidate division WOR-3 bacterium]|nr:CNNM domain-containing protein [candidate division WOR-3 bacterium]